MPLIKLNKKALEKNVGKKLPDKVLLEKIPFLGTPVEQNTPEEITIEVFPNRPDMLSMQGFSRALSTFLEITKGLKNYSAKKSDYKIIIEKSVTGIRPYTACAVVKGLSLDDEKIKEIIDLQEKIHITYGRNRKKLAAGIYPLEKIKFPIRYMAKKPEEIKFCPLEFRKEISAKEILEEHPAGKAYGNLLEGLSRYPLFVDANNNIMSMPPVINSETVGKVTEKTKDVFIECSGFEFDYLSKGLNMIVTALCDMGGTIHEVILQYPKHKKTPNLKPEKFRIDLDYANKRLGTSFKKIQVKELLEKMGLGFKENKAIVPCYRADILHQVDLVEDIAIAYGYENFKEAIPKISTIGKEDGFSIFENHVRDILVGLGFLEVKNFHLSSESVQNQKVLTNKDVVRIEKSFSEEYSVLRRMLTPQMLEVFQKNNHNEHPQNVFEVGKVIKSFEKENTRLCAGICGIDANFTKIKQVAEAITEQLGIKFRITEAKAELYQTFVPGRIGIFEVNKQNIAHLGEVHPEVLTNFEIDMPVAILEMDLEKLYKLLNS